MPRTARVAPGGMIFHVLNRANARARIFRKEADYAAFRWSSLWRWRHAEVTEDVPPLTEWPVERPRQWLFQVNRPQPKAELEAVQISSQRGRLSAAQSGRRRPPRSSDSNRPFSLVENQVHGQ